MTLQELIQSGVTAAALARDVGCHRSYITRCAKGEGGRSLSRAAAIKIWKARKIKVAPIASLTDREISVLEKVGG